ncbi:TPA: hypothetical protein N2696_002802 [Vibrio parahaemolyticus]|uniref:hypothetical protein n=1 Tax=Vibrio parahaemolyticus TaxID=670 RepID=UPI0004A356ED|nr:hypothetical protein [Vibrio parahaemolyticus]EGR2360496.1 hypothetical protein [Vibrio parahaemolyticus]EGR3424706.1 hypothetical protein [Vibrio parahaemolyticus]EJG0580496.1 hypothetical protein [Vibrio parahaemolyticus]MBC8658882.1 hypothetical protein [Vibrio parahaemolyticus]MBE3946663.1 hypothetical protein [Vibrio parahaemolyticus]
MNKILAGLLVILMPLAISNISFSNNYGQLNSTLDTLSTQQGVVLERTDIILNDIDSIKATTKRNGERIEALERILID